MGKLNTRRWFSVVVVMLIVATFVLAAFPRHASAASDLVTKGDVEAIMNAQTAGGLFHGKPVPGFDDYPRAAITPLSYNDGRHYCVDDWHVVRIAEGAGVGDGFFPTRQDAIADLEATTFTLTLDGVTLPLHRSPIRMLNAAEQQRLGFPGPLFEFEVASILSPDALSVGQHTVGVVDTDPIFGTTPFQYTSPFTVDPSGTGACLQSI